MFSSVLLTNRLLAAGVLQAFFLQSFLQPAEYIPDTLLQALIVDVVATLFVNEDHNLLAKLPPHLRLKYMSELYHCLSVE